MVNESLALSVFEATHQSDFASHNTTHHTYDAFGYTKFLYSCTDDLCLNLYAPDVLYNATRYLLGTFLLSEFDIRLATEYLRQNAPTPVAGSTGFAQTGFVLDAQLPVTGLTTARRNHASITSRDAILMVTSIGVWSLGAKPTDIQQAKNFAVGLNEQFLDQAASDGPPGMYAGLACNSSAWPALLYGDSLDRLSHIKSRVDPTNVLNFSKSIPGCPMSCTPDIVADPRVPPPGRRPLFASLSCPPGCAIGP